MTTVPAARARSLPHPTTDYQPAAALRAALRRFDARTEHLLERHRLTPTRYQLLLFIQAADDAGRRATVTSLRAPLQTGQAGVTQLVAAAVAAGLVEKTLSTRDRRSSHLTLTSLGARRLRAAHAELGEERAILADVIGQQFPTAT